MQAVPSVSFSTVGHSSFHAGYELPLWFDDAPRVHEADILCPRWAICLIRKGTVTIQEGRRIVLVTAPALILLDESVRPSFERAHVLEMTTAYFHPSLVNRAFMIDALSTDDPRKHYQGTAAEPDVYLVERFSRRDLAERIYPLGASTRVTVEHLFEQTATEARQQHDQFWPCRTRSFFIQILFQARLIEKQEGPSVLILDQETGGNTILRALQYVHERFCDNVKLEEVAKACATNRTSLNAAFKITTGMTMHAYLASLRIQLATTLLRDTAIPVSEVVQRTGYSNTSHFTRFFRERLGCSPSEYRTKHCWILNS